MNKHLSSVSDQLQSLLKEYSLENNYLEYELKSNWSSIVPPQISKITEPEKIVQNVLYLRVTNESWKKEIRKKQKELLQMINDYLKESYIKVIKLV